MTPDHQRNDYRISHKNAFHKGHRPISIKKRTFGVSSKSAIERHMSCPLSTKRPTNDCIVSDRPYESYLCSENSGNSTYPGLLRSILSLLADIFVLVKRICMYRGRLRKARIWLSLKQHLCTDRDIVPKPELTPFALFGAGTQPARSLLLCCLWKRIILTFILLQRYRACSIRV